MSFRPFVLVLVVCIPLTGVFAQSSYQWLSEKVQSSTHGAMKLLRQNGDGSPSVLIGVSDENAELVASGSRNSERDVSLASRAWMASISESVLGLSTEAELREISTIRTKDVWLSSYELFYQGIPVRERIAHLNIGALNGKVIMLRNTLPTVLPKTYEAKVSKEFIMNESDAIVGSGATVIEDAQLVFIHHHFPERLLLAYETTIRNAESDELWRLRFDAETGKLIEKKDLIIKNCFSESPHQSTEELSEHISTRPSSKQQPMATGTGTVYALIHPASPVDSLVSKPLANLKLTVNGLTSYTDSDGSFTVSGVSSPLIISCESMKGKYLTVSRHDAPSSNLIDTIVSNPASLYYDNSNSDVSERDVYVSIERIRSHVRTLDTQLTRLDLPMEANVNFNSECNAFYDPSQRRFTFFASSTTCNNTAQISDVVYHEFGHRVNHARYSQAAGQNVNINMDDGNLNEGFADVISAFLRDDPRIGIHFYTTSATRVLRNINNTNKWPKNINSDPHYNGLIVAGAFWDLRETLGLEETEQLFHQMCYQRPDGSGGTSAAELEEAFTNTLLATIITDDDDNNLVNGTPNMQKILDAFDKHGITLSGLIELSTEQIADQGEEALVYPVRMTATYTSLIGEIDTTQLRIYYRLIDSAVFQSVPAKHHTDNTYIGLIPRVPKGSIVEYYGVASTTLSQTAVKESPHSTTPLRFLVGYKMLLSDECESGSGWANETSSDNATKGVWVHALPKGTYYQNAAQQFVQQDTDHTPTGVHCFVTGNEETTTPSLDDVDNGITTLISPAFDLSEMLNPVIRWHYYYSNNTGLNPGLAKWVVKLSNDDGVNYTTIHSTTQATDGWVQYEARVRDYKALTDKVRIEFIASDNIGALVEAGVDDIQIFDAPLFESTPQTTISTSTVALFPNPVSGQALNLSIKDIDKNTSVTLRDVLGNSIISVPISRAASEWIDIHIPLSIPNGVYFIELSSQGQMIREKFVIVR